MIKTAPKTKTDGRLTLKTGTGFLTRALCKYCRFFYLPIQELLDTLKMNSSSVLVNLLATDSSYNMGRELGRAGQEFEVITNQHVVEQLWLCVDMRKPGFMIIRFAWTINYATRLKRPAIGERSTLLTNTKCLQDLLRRESLSTRESSFSIYEIRPKICRVRKKPSTMSIRVSKWSIFGSWFSTMTTVCRQCTNTNCQVRTRYLAASNIFSEISPSFFPNTVYDTGRPVTKSGPRPVFWSQQKAMPVLQHIFKELIPLGAVVLHTYMETGATATCLMEQKHCKYTDCDSYGTCEEKVILSEVEIFWRLGRSKDFDIARNVEVRNAAKIYVQHCKTTRVSIKIA